MPSALALAGSALHAKRLGSLFLSPKAHREQMCPTATEGNTDQARCVLSIDWWLSTALLMRHACCLQGRSNRVRHDSDSSHMAPTHLRGLRLGSLIGSRFSERELFISGAFNMGRMCVECQHCDAMMWVCELSASRSRNLAVSPGSLIASLMLSAL